MGRFVRLEIRLVIMGINLWRGWGMESCRLVPHFKPVRPANGSARCVLRDARNGRARWRKARLVPVLAFPDVWVASIAIAKQQLKLMRLYTGFGGFFARQHGIGLAQRRVAGLMPSRNGT